MTIGDFTKTSLLIPCLLATDQASVLNSLSHRLETAGCIEDSLTFFQAALQRDYLSSAVTSDGVAFAHARGRGIQRLAFALGLSDAGVRWRDGSQVRAVFLIAIPASDAQLYLMLAAALARLVRTENFLSALLACELPEEMMHLLDHAQVHVPAKHSSAKIARHAA